MTTAQLPNFSRSPVIEVALSVSFEPLSGLRTPQLGLLWDSAFSKRFPRIEEKPSTQPAIESFEPGGTSRPTVSFEVLQKPPSPRLWFLNDLGTELVQVQQDWFARNWRKLDEPASYPRYPVVRERFVEDCEAFVRYIEEHKLGTVVPTQCELTYVNHIQAGPVWSNHGELEKVLEIVSPEHVGRPGTPESMRVALQYLIPDAAGQPLGRLHITAVPGFRRDTKEPIFVVTMTARGRPAGEGLAGVYSFLDIGHEWVVRAFDSITSDAMHEEWGRDA